MPETTDFVVGLDPTGSTTITGAQLAQLVNSAYPQTDKGLVIVTTDPEPEPDVVATPKWKRYIWVRQSVSSVGLYVYNDSSAAWESINVAGIGAGSIVNSMIADNTIEDVKIVSLSYSKITGAPSGLTPSGAAGGDLGATGSTYPNPTIKDSAITTAKINNLAVTSDKIETAASASTGIDYTKLRGSGSAYDFLWSKSGSPYSMEFFPANKMVQATTGQVNLTTPYSVPRVNGAGTAFEMIPNTSLGRIAQIVRTVSTTIEKTNYGTGAGNYPYVLIAGQTSATGLKLCTTTSGTPAATTNMQLSTGLSASITPVATGTKTLLVEVTVPMGSSVVGAMVLGLFTSNASLAVPVAIAYAPGTSGSVLSTLTLRYLVDAAAGVAQNFYVGFGCTAATNNAFINSYDGTNSPNAVAQQASITVTEYV